MKGIFWGFFLIFINFYVTINGHTLNLLPTFAGYILLYRAAGELLGESGRFGKLRPFAVAVAIYTGILWVGDLLGVTGANWLSTLLELAALAVALYISWSVIQAILEMETHYGTDLNGTSARTAWFVLLAAQIAGTLGGLLLDALALMALIALLVGIIWFLAALWKCAGLYDVHKDSLRPFIVRMNGAEVTVLGTSFNVNTYGDDGQIYTTLVNGSVRVASMKNKFFQTCHN